MKKQTTVAGSKHKPPYNVFDFYKDEGPVQRLAKHPYFEYVTLFVTESAHACSYYSSTRSVSRYRKYVNFGC